MRGCVEFDRRILIRGGEGEKVFAVGEGVRYFEVSRNDLPLPSPPSRTALVHGRTGKVWEEALVGPGGGGWRKKGR